MRTYRGAVLSYPVLSRVSGRRPSRRVHTAGSREAGCRHPRVRAAGTHVGVAQVAVKLALALAVGLMLALALHLHWHW